MWATRSVVQVGVELWVTLPLGLLTTPYPVISIAAFSGYLLLLPVGMGIVDLIRFLFVK